MVSRYVSREIQKTSEWRCFQIPAKTEWLSCTSFSRFRYYYQFKSVESWMGYPSLWTLSDFSPSKLNETSRMRTAGELYPPRHTSATRELPLKLTGICSFLNPTGSNPKRGCVYRNVIRVCETVGIQAIVIFSWKSGRCCSTDRILTPFDPTTGYHLIEDGLKIQGVG